MPTSPSLLSRFLLVVRRPRGRRPFAAVLTLSIAMVISGLPAQSIEAGAIERAPSDSPPSEAGQSTDTQGSAATVSAPPISPRSRPDLSKFNPERAELVERTAGADIYQFDGSKVAVVHAGKVNWNDRGTWKPIDARLVPDASGGFRNMSGPLAVTFPAVAGPTAPLVQASKDEWSIAFGLEGAAEKRPGVADGARMLYADIQAGVDLEYEMGPSSVKEILVLEKRPDGAAPGRFRFPLTVTGVTPRSDDDGSIGFYDATGEGVGVIPPGLAWDSSAASPGDAAAVAVTVKLAGQPGAWAVEVEAPAQWIDDPGRVWPLRLDPTFTAGQDNDGEDAFDSSATPSGTYNNAAQFDSQLGAYVNRIGYSSYPSNEHYTYLKFDLASVAGKQITASELRFYTFSKADPGNWFWIKKADQNWEDYNVSRDDWIAHSGEKAVSTATAGAETGINVTDWTTGWAATPSTNYGVVMNTNGLNGYVRIGASEQKYNGSFTYPRLIVGWNSVPTVPNLIGPANGSTSPVAPTLAATYDDADGGTGTVDFEISGYPVQSFAAPSGGYASYAPTLGNGTYSWRARARDSSATSNWSTWWTFTINNTPPSLPDLLAPEDGYFSRSPYTVYARYTDPNGGAGTIHFEVLGYGTYSVPAAHGATVSYTPPPTVPAGVYSWRARAFDGFAYSAWTEWRGGTIKKSSLALREEWTTPGGSTASWPTAKWTTSSSGSSRIVDINGDRGRMYVASSTARATATTPDLTDVELSLTYSFSDRSSDGDLRLTLRGSGTTGNNQMPAGYRLDIDADSTTVKLKKVVAGTASTIGSFTYNYDPANPQQRHRVRFHVVGSTLRVRMWPAGTPEPTTSWNLETNNTAVTTPGKVQITHYYAGTALTVFVDNATVTSEILWGVDSVEPMDQTRLNDLTSQYAGTPDVWGRYLHDEHLDGTSNTTYSLKSKDPNEVEFARTNNIPIMVIDRNPGTDILLGEADGRAFADMAADHAVAKGIPTSVAIFANIEVCTPSCAVDAGWIWGWFDQIDMRGYKVGFYAAPTTNPFKDAFCSAATDHARLRSESYLFASTPSVGRTRKTAAPAYAPNSPNCPGFAVLPTMAWQYGLGGQPPADPNLNDPAPVDFDTDLFKPEIADVLYRGYPPCQNCI